MADLILPGQSELGLALREPNLLAPGRQLAGRVRVDWENPQNKGLVAGFVSGQGLRDIAKGAGVSLVGNIARSVGQRGLSFRGAYQASNNYILIERTYLTYTAEVTFEALIQVNAFQTVKFPYISTVIGQYQFQLPSTNLVGPILRFNHTATLADASVPTFMIVRSGLTENVVYGTGQSVDVPIHLLGTYKSGSLDLYCNGVRTTTSAFTGNFINHAANYVTLLSGFVGANPEHNRCLNGHLFYARILNRWTPPAEAYARYEDQLGWLKPANDSTYLIQTAVAALPTLSSATAINITASGFQPRVTATY